MLLKDKIKQALRRAKELEAEIDDLCKQLKTGVDEKGNPWPLSSKVKSLERMIWIEETLNKECQ